MKKKKNLMTFSFTILISLIVFPMLVFPVIFGNGSGSGYQRSAGNRGGGTGEIEAYVIRGAGHYINAYGEILGFLNRYEMEPLSGIDFAECSAILNRALAHLDGAVATYRVLIKTAALTPYDEGVISRLRDFDFTAFMKGRGSDVNDLPEVTDLLRAGDITGVYQWIYSRLQGLRSALNTVKHEVSQNRLPAVNSIWELNRLCTHTMLVGQDLSQIFNEI